MHYDRNELVLLYNEQNEKDRKTLAYAMTITSKVNRQEVNSVRFSDTMFGIMLDRLNVNGKKVVNKADPQYQVNFKGKELSGDDWHAVIRNNPYLLRSPIAMFRNKVIICETPTDVLKVL
jgi:arsenate reductase